MENFKYNLRGSYLYTFNSNMFYECLALRAYTVYLHRNNKVLFNGGISNVYLFTVIIRVLSRTEFKYTLIKNNTLKDKQEITFFNYKNKNFYL